MRALRKGQAATISSARKRACAGSRIVERAFGIGVSALAEAISVFGEKLNVQPA